jgi:hypothetical protein
MKKLLILSFAILAISVPAVARAQKCEGPEELCAHIFQLQKDLDSQRKLAADAKKAEIDSKRVVLTLKSQQEDQDTRTTKFIGAMGTLAIVLKILLNLLTSWKNTLFQSDKGKAGIRISILVVTLGIFLTTNMGFGIPWWQALILAAGGPLSMVLHEMMKLIPVLMGKGTLPPDDPTPQI